MGQTNEPKISDEFRFFLHTITCFSSRKIGGSKQRGHSRKPLNDSDGKRIGNAKWAEKFVISEY